MSKKPSRRRGTAFEKAVEKAIALRLQSPRLEDQTPNCAKLCRICFVSDCKLFKLVKGNNLDQTYRILSGITKEDDNVIPPYLCSDCAKTLLNVGQLRSIGQQSRSVLQEVSSKHNSVTLQSIASVIGENFPVDSQLDLSQAENVDLTIEGKNETEDFTDSDNCETTDRYNEFIDKYYISTQNRSFELNEHLAVLRDIADDIDGTEEDDSASNESGNDSDVTDDIDGTETDESENNETGNDTDVTGDSDGTEEDESANNETENDTDVTGDSDGTEEDESANNETANDTDVVNPLKPMETDCVLKEELSILQNLNDEFMRWTRTIHEMEINKVIFEHKLNKLFDDTDDKNDDSAKGCKGVEEPDKNDVSENYCVQLITQTDDFDFKEVLKELSELGHDVENIKIVEEVITDMNSATANGDVYTQLPVIQTESVGDEADDKVCSCVNVSPSRAVQTDDIDLDEETEDYVNPTDDIFDIQIKKDDTISDTADIGDLKDLHEDSENIMSTNDSAQGQSKENFERNILPKLTDEFIIKSGQPRRCMTRSQHRSLADKRNFVTGNLKRKTSEELWPSKIVRMIKHTKKHTEKPAECEQIAYKSIKDITVWNKLTKTGIKFGSCNNSYKTIVKKNKVEIKQEYTCNACQRCFKNKYFHKKHSELCRKYTCMICKEHFRFQFEIDVHNRLHTGEKAFSCDVCGKNFNFKISLILHSANVHPNKSKVDLKELIKRETLLTRC